MPRMLCRYSTHCTLHCTYHGVRSDAGLHADHVQLQRVSVCIACLACPVSPRVTCHRCVRLRCPHATAGQLQYFDINPPHSAARLAAAAGGASCGPHTGDRDPARPSPGSRRSEPGWTRGRARRAVRRRGRWRDIKFISRARAAAGQ